MLAWIWTCVFPPLCWIAIFKIVHTSEAAIMCMVSRTHNKNADLKMLFFCAVRLYSRFILDRQACFCKMYLNSDCRLPDKNIHGDRWPYFVSHILKRIKHFQKQKVLCHLTSSAKGRPTFVLYPCVLNGSSLQMSKLLNQNLSLSHAHAEYFTINCYLYLIAETIWILFCLV